MIDLQTLNDSEPDFALVALGKDQTIITNRKSKGVQSKGTTASPIRLGSISLDGQSCLYVQDLGGPTRLRLLDLHTRADYPIADIPSNHMVVDVGFAGSSGRDIVYSLARIPMTLRRLFVAREGGKIQAQDITPLNDLLAFDFMTPIPNTEKVVFQSPVANDHDENASVWVFDLGNLELRRFRQHARPLISPDGKLMAMSEILEANGVSFAYRLVIYEVGRYELVSSFDINSWGFLFSSDSNRILIFQRHQKTLENPLGQWLVVDLRNGEQKVLPLDANWRPIAWSSRDFLYLYNEKTGAVMQYSLGSTTLKELGRDIGYIILKVW